MTPLCPWAQWGRLGAVGTAEEASRGHKTPQARLARGVFARHGAIPRRWGLPAKLPESVAARVRYHRTFIPLQDSKRKLCQKAEAPPDRAPNTFLIARGRRTPAWQMVPLAGDEVRQAGRDNHPPWNPFGGGGRREHQR